MKIAVVYLRIIQKYVAPRRGQFPYESYTARFLSAYNKFKPKIAHDLIIVDCGAVHTDRMFDEVATYYARYDGGGYDCGAYQDVCASLEHDLVVCLNTYAYMWVDGWLEHFAEAYDLHGPGLYGATGSFEEHPHLRTPAIAFAPEVIQAYPARINSRPDAVLFECGPRNFALYSMSIDYPVRVVAKDGLYHLFDSDKIQNGFRDGNQSNVLVWDRHTDLYNSFNQPTKLLFNKSARTLKNWFPDERLMK